VNTQNITRDDWIIGGVALLLVIDLLLLPWFSISAGPFSFDLTATDAPDGIFGILAVLAAIVLIADLAVERVSPQTTVPSVGGSRTQTRFVLAALVALFVVLKFIFNVHFSDFGLGFWLGVILTAALVYVAMQARRSTAVGVAGGV
jgi:hypothetical protein